MSSSTIALGECTIEGLYSSLSKDSIRGGSHDL